MRALVLDGIPRVATDIEEPARAPGEALIAVRVAGICDTDLQLARGYMGFRGVPGHEMVGEVVTADDVRWIGRRVVADINAGCGACDDCRTRGRPPGHHCPKRTVLGILGRSGAFAERLTIPERCLVEVPDGLDDDRAVFAEPLAAALHVLDDLDAGASGASAQRVMVLGDGKLGLLIAFAVAASGARVTVVGHHRSKLAIAAAAGIDTVLESELDGRGVTDVVVEATGTAGGLARALELVRPRGTIILKSTVASPITVDLAPAIVHEIRLIGSRCGDMRAAIDALAAQRVDPRPLIAARYPLARADEALAYAGTRGVMKVLLDA